MLEAVVLLEQISEMFATLGSKEDIMLMNVHIEICIMMESPKMNMSTMISI